MHRKRRISAIDSRIAIASLVVASGQFALAADPQTWAKGQTGKIVAGKELKVTKAGTASCAGAGSEFILSAVRKADADVVFSTVNACATPLGSITTTDVYQGTLAELTSATLAQETVKDKTTFFENWGVGLAVVKNSRSAINDASIVGGVVRVNSQSDYDASLLVARHFYPFRKVACTEQRNDNADATIGGVIGDCLGAMVGVGLGGTAAGSNGSQIINFVGVGLVTGGEVKGDPNTKWNFGIGIGRKFNVKVLGDGFEANQAPPAGETQVRTKSIDMNAKFLFFTAHW